MIARLTGTVVDKGADHAIIDVGGVGYLVHASLTTLSAWPPSGERVTVRIHTHVRDDALELYGFADEVEEAVFHELIATPNIGCKKAMTILSGLPAEEIVAAVRDQDVARLSKAHGVGKKTAERLVLELKDRLLGLGLGDGGEGEGRSPKAERIVSDLVSGLTHLGYRADAARKAAESVVDDLGPVELPMLLKEALVRLR